MLHTNENLNKIGGTIYHEWKRFIEITLLHFEMLAYFLRPRRTETFTFNQSRYIYAHIVAPFTEVRIPSPETNAVLSVASDFRYERVERLIAVAVGQYRFVVLLRVSQHVCYLVNDVIWIIRRRKLCGYCNWLYTCILLLVGETLTLYKRIQMLDRAFLWAAMLSSMLYTQRGVLWNHFQPSLKEPTSKRTWGDKVFLCRGTETLESSSN